MPGWPSSILAATLTEKRCRIRNSATLSWAAFSSRASSLGSAGRTVSFQPSVSGSSRATDHLSTGEQLTPGTQDAECDHEREHHGIGHRVAPIPVDCLVMIVADAHEADPSHVDGYD